MHFRVSKCILPMKNFCFSRLVCPRSWLAGYFMSSCFPLLVVAVKRNFRICHLHQIRTSSSDGNFREALAISLPTSQTGSMHFGLGDYNKSCSLTPHMCTRNGIIFSCCSAIRVIVKVNRSSNVLQRCSPAVINETKSISGFSRLARAIFNFRWKFFKQQTKQRNCLESQ